MKLIQEGTTLYPEYNDCYNLFFNNMPYAYWDKTFNAWILYKEYNNYKTVNKDFISVHSKEDMINNIRFNSSFNEQDRDELRNNFKQLSLIDKEN